MKLKEINNGLKKVYLNNKVQRKTWKNYIKISNIKIIKIQLVNLNKLNNKLLRIHHGLKKILLSKLLINN